MNLRLFRKSNWVAYAEKEFALLANSYDKKDPDQRPIVLHFRKEILSIIRKLSRQGHSGASAPYFVGAVANAISSLGDFLPLGDLCDNPNDWKMVGAGFLQNKRLSALFRRGKNSAADYLYAITWKTESGMCFGGTVDGISSSQNVRWPFRPKTFYVDVVEGEDKEHHIKDRAQLEAVWAYYDKKDVAI